MAVLTTHGGACRAGVPFGYIKTVTETHVPVVKMFCVILLPVVVAWTAGWQIGTRPI